MGMFVELLKEYGIVGLGWGFTILLIYRIWRVSDRERDTLLHALKQNTNAMNSLASKIEVLVMIRRDK